MSKKVSQVIKAVVDFYDWNNGYNNGIEEKPFNNPVSYPGTGNRERDMERNGNYIDGYSKGSEDIGRE